MKTLTLNVPEEVDEREVKLSVAYILFDKGLFSSGEAALFGGVTKRNFLENASSYGISIFGETVEDLKGVTFI